MDTQKVYIFRNSVGLYKIGISVNPERRCKQMKLASGIDVVIIKVYEVEKPAIQIESLLHKHFSKFRKHGEWFAFENFNIVKIDKLIKKFDSNSDDSSSLVEHTIKQITDINYSKLENLVYCKELFHKQNKVLESLYQKNRKCFDEVLDCLCLEYEISTRILSHKGVARTPVIDTVFSELMYNIPIVKKGYKNKVLSYYALHIANIYMEAHDRFIECYLKDCDTINNQQNTLQPSCA